VRAVAAPVTVQLIPFGCGLTSSLLCTGPDMGGPSFTGAVPSVPRPAMGISPVSSTRKWYDHSSPCAANSTGNTPISCSHTCNTSFFAPGGGAREPTGGGRLMAREIRSAGNPRATGQGVVAYACRAAAGGIR
jgi:hypothetical protein